MAYPSTPSLRQARSAGRRSRPPSPPRPPLPRAAASGARNTTTMLAFGDPPWQWIHFLPALHTPAGLPLRIPGPGTTAKVVIHGGSTISSSIGSHSSSSGCSRSSLRLHRLATVLGHLPRLIPGAVQLTTHGGTAALSSHSSRAPRVPTRPPRRPTAGRSAIPGRRTGGPSSNSLRVPPLLPPPGRPLLSRAPSRAVAAGVARSRLSRSSSSRAPRPRLRRRLPLAAGRSRIRSGAPSPASAASAPLQALEALAPTLPGPPLSPRTLQPPTESRRRPQRTCGARGQDRTGSRRAVWPPTATPRRRTPGACRPLSRRSCHLRGRLCPSCHARCRRGAAARRCPRTSCPPSRSSRHPCPRRRQPRQR
mmetsp:Transcript_4689/g.9666  ORF Transcript_4689/g.9666 Transcript_4689/m.9666 type:complete len:365 (+) Transcript_4689:180-1274(+)